MPSSPTRHRVALAIALLGVAVAAETLVVSLRLGADARYTSFCNVGTVVNCDVVLTSHYGKFLGLPVAGWGVGAFTLGAVLALPGALGAGGAGFADLLLLGLVSASLGYAAVLGAAMATLGHLCLLCASLDVVILAWCVAVLPLVARFAPTPAGGWWRGRVAARAVMAAGLALAVAGGTLAAVQAPEPATTVAEVQARDPKFYQWYTALPVHSAAALDTTGYRKGPADAPVCIVEFSDFQCPHCAQAFRDLRALVHARPDVRVVYRNFPLDPSCNRLIEAPMHENACLAACAAECAGQQGKFWDYHDMLFENQEHLERGSLFRYAREMGIDLAAFRTCIDDPATRARIGDDVATGISLGINQTPTLYINGRVVPGLREPIHYEYAVIIEHHARDSHETRGAS
jgi:protein-disulfide isomerase/uncharacterized membrane protein